MFSQDPNTNMAVVLEADRVRRVQACGQTGQSAPSLEAWASAAPGASDRPERSWVGGVAVATFIALIRLLGWRVDSN